MKEELKKENEEEEQDVKLITSIFVFMFNERMCLKKNKTCLKDFSASDEKMMEKKFLVFNPYSLTWLQAEEGESYEVDELKKQEARNTSSETCCSIIFDKKQPDQLQEQILSDNKIHCQGESEKQQKVQEAIEEQEESHEEQRKRKNNWHIPWQLTHQKFL